MGREHIHKELEKISDLVSEKLKYHSLPKAPEGYFDELENQLMGQARLTRFIPPQQRYSIPEGYFDQKENEWVSTTRKSSSLSWIGWGMAASFLIVVSGVWFLHHSSTHKVDDTEIAWVYLENNLDQFEMEELIQYQLLEEADFEDLEVWQGENFDSLSVEEFLD